MAKLRQSFTVDELHRDILRMKPAALGVSKSEYIRTLIERDAYPEWGTGGPNEAQRWKSLRHSIMANPRLERLLKALYQEFDSKQNSKPVCASRRAFAEKYGLSQSEVTQGLSELVRAGVFESSKGAFVWTYQGILMLPELASTECRDGGFLSGGVAPVIRRLLGEYEELVRFFSTVFNVDLEASDQIVQITLAFARDFFVWLVEIVFPMDGIPEMNATTLWRESYLTFVQSLCDFLQESSGKGIPPDTRELLGQLSQVIHDYKTIGELENPEQ